MDKLAEPSLRQLNQRIAVRFTLSPLTREETNHYIDHRLNVAESRGVVSFTDEAIDLIHSHSQGIPRLINIVCGNALLLGFGAGKRKIDESIVREVVADLTRQTPRIAAVAREGAVQPDVAAAITPQDSALSSANPTAPTVPMPTPWWPPMWSVGAQPRHADSAAQIARGEPPTPNASPSWTSSAAAPLASPVEQPWTLVEAAAYLRISVGLLRRLLRSGEIRGRQVGRTWRVLRQELDRYVSGEAPPRNGAGDPDRPA
jgi:excisionase family DNA binding protein